MQHRSPAAPGPAPLHPGEVENKLEIPESASDLFVFEREDENYGKETLDAASLVSNNKQISQFEVPTDSLKLHSIRQIASTDYANVFEGICTGDASSEEVKVAIKVLRVGARKGSSAWKNLIREVERWSRLQHRHITPFLGYGKTSPTDPTGPYLLSPYRTNGQIMQYIGNHPDCDRLSLVVQIATGIRYLHTLNPPIVHMNLEPSNILINDFGEAEILGFSMSRIVEDEDDGYSSTGGSSSAELLVFMSPQLLEEGIRGGPPEDVYAFGAIMLVVLSGRRPFAGQRAIQIIMKKTKGELPRRSDHDIKVKDTNAVWTLFEHCWAREPENRPPMSEVLEQLLLLHNEEQKLLPS